MSISQRERAQILKVVKVEGECLEGGNKEMGEGKENVGREMAFVALSGNGGGEKVGVHERT